jgi:hypothetical protein
MAVEAVAELIPAAVALAVHRLRAETAAQDQPAPQQQRQVLNLAAAAADRKAATLARAATAWSG